MFKSSKVLLSLIISISCTNSMDYVNDNSSTKNWQNVFLSTILNNGGDDINLVSLLDPDYINKKESFNKQLTNTYNTKLDINNINLKLNGNENNNTMENKQLPNNNKNNNPLLQKKRGQKSEIKMEIIKNEIIKKYGDIFYDLFDENKYKEIPLEHKSRYNRIAHDFNAKLCNIIKKENNTNKSIAYSTMMNNKQKYEKELSQFREYRTIFKNKLNELIKFHKSLIHDGRGRNPLYKIKETKEKITKKKFDYLVKFHKAFSQDRLGKKPLYTRMGEKDKIFKEKYDSIFYDLFDENKYKEIPLEHKSRYNRIVYDFNTKLCNIIKKENNTNKSIAYSTMMNNKQKYEKELSQFREYKYIFKDKLSPLIAFHEAFLPLDEQNE